MTRLTGYGRITSVIVIVRGEETHSGTGSCSHRLFDDRQQYNTTTESGYSRTESESQAAAGRAGRAAAGGAERAAGRQRSAASNPNNIFNIRDVGAKRLLVKDGSGEIHIPTYW